LGSMCALYTGSDTRSNFISYQVVWASTCAVGCAQVQCPSGSGFQYLVVCNYGPALDSFLIHSLTIQRQHCREHRPHESHLRASLPQRPGVLQVRQRLLGRWETVQFVEKERIESLDPTCSGDALTQSTEAPATTTAAQASSSRQPSSAQVTTAEPAPSTSQASTIAANFVVPPESLPPSKLWPLNPDGPIGRPSLPGDFTDNSGDQNVSF